MRAALFPPRGTRGAGPTTRAGGWGLLDRTQYLSQETIHCIQFETVDSFERISDMLDVDGVNAALLGRVDLAVSLGVPDTDARLDTLFLVMPNSWKGTLAQYVGRLHRDHDGKRKVVVYDYVDRAVPVLARMAAKYEKGYKALGYVLES